LASQSNGNRTAEAANLAILETIFKNIARLKVFSSFVLRKKAKENACPKLR
jgi:hypothetical protein